MKYCLNFKKYIEIPTCKPDPFQYTYSFIEFEMKRELNVCYVSFHILTKSSK